MATYKLKHTGGVIDDAIDKAITAITESSITDNLTTDDANKVLSAKQGKVLNERLNTAESDIGELDSRLTEIGATVATNLLTTARHERDITQIENTLSALNYNNEPRVSISSYAKSVALPKNVAGGALFPTISGATEENIITYDTTTWAEWVVTGEGTITKDSSGMTLSPIDYAQLEATYTFETPLKPSLTYGILLEVLEKTFSGSVYVQGAFDNELIEDIFTTGIVAKKIKTGTSSLDSMVLSMPSENGSYIKIKNIRVFELPDGSDILNNFNTLTAEQLNEIYPYFDSTKSAIAPRLRVAGKNLYQTMGIQFPQIFKGVTVTYDAATQAYILNGTSTGAGNITLSINPKPLIAGKTYNLARFIVGGSATAPDGTSLLWSPFSIDGTQYTNRLSDSASTLNSPSRNTPVIWLTESGGSGYQLTLQLVGASGGIIFNNFKVNLQITEDAYSSYEPHRAPTTQYATPYTLCKLPNGIADTISNGKYTKRVESYTIKSSDLTSFGSLTNVDYVLLKKPQDYVFYGKSSSLATNKNILLQGMSCGTFSDNVNAFNTVYNSTTTDFGILLEKGKYTLSTIRVELTGKTLYYQLTSPTITENATRGLLIGSPGGIVTAEPILNDIGFYNDSFVITNTDFPAIALDSLYRVNVEDGASTKLDETVAVIASDGLSFTHPGLMAGDLVDVDYFYEGKTPRTSQKYSYLDSNHVLADTANGKYYTYKPVITNGAIASWTVTEVQ